MREEAGVPSLIVLTDWHIQEGRVYGFARDDRRYITARLDKNAEQRPVRDGRLIGEGIQFVLGRPLGSLE